MPAILAGLIFFVSGGLAVTLQRYTLVQWWLPTVICCIPAAIIAYLTGHRIAGLSRIRSRVANMAVMFVLLTVLFDGAVYATNYFASADDAAHTEQALVIRKYREEHYKTRRVSRRTTVRGEKYYTYNIDIRLDNGMTKQIGLNLERYNSVRRGDSIILNVSMGALGMPVFKNFNPQVQHTGYRVK